MKVSTSDDDDGGGKPRLEGIMEASILDDLGGSSVFDRIVEYYRSRHNSRNGHSHLGRGQDVHTIKMAGQETRPQIPMSALSRTED